MIAVTATAATATVAIALASTSTTTANTADVGVETIVASCFLEALCASNPPPCYHLISRVTTVVKVPSDNHVCGPEIGV